MKSQKKEIIWNVVNCLLAGALVLLGAMTDGGVDFNSFMIALVASGIVAVSQFKEFWTKEKNEYCPARLFSFIR